MTGLAPVLKSKLPFVVFSKKKKKAKNVFPNANFSCMKILLCIKGQKPYLGRKKKQEFLRKTNFLITQNID